MSEPVLIATIMRADGDTGVQTHFRAFFDYLVRQGRSVRLFTPFDAPKWLVYPVFAFRRLLDPVNGAVSVWWYRFWHAVFLQSVLKRALHSGDPCVIYAQCPLSAQAALNARRSNCQKVKMVVHFNISQADEWVGKGKFSENSKIYNAIRRFEGEVMPRLDGLVFVSDFMRAELTKRIPSVAGVRFEVIPNFLSDPGEDQASEPAQVDLVCIGTLEPRKNQIYALEIVAAAKNAGRRLTLTIVGDGPNRSELERKCKELDIYDLVTFAGYLKATTELFQRHKACLHVAHMESFGIILIEAMSRGLPVFATQVGGMIEVFSEGVEGRFIPLGNSEAAAKLILEWLESPDQMQRAGKAARKRYLSSFEESGVARRLAGFLDN